MVETRILKEQISSRGMGIEIVSGGGAETFKAEVQKE